MQPKSETDASGRGTELNDLGLPKGYRFRPDWEVTPRQVKGRLDAGEDLLLIDCRTPREEQLVRIEGARLVPLQDLADHLSDLRPHRERPIVVYCHHGGRSLQMTAALRNHGFVNVQSMAGGIDVWATDVQPTLPRY